MGCISKLTLVHKKSAACAMRSSDVGDCFELEGRQCLHHFAPDMGQDACIAPLPPDSVGWLDGAQVHHPTDIATQSLSASFLTPATPWLLQPFCTL
eukprot:s416_g29.t1